MKLVTERTVHFTDEFKKIYKAHGPRAVLLTDITYLSYNGKRCYLSVILDSYTKQVLAHCLSESLAVDFVLETVRGLLEVHGGELKTDTRLHSDQRCHYTSVAFTELLQNSGLRQSMSRRGNCWDNAPQESFLGHMKDEVDIRRCESFDGVRVQIKVWMDYYTRERTLPVGLKKLSPDEYWEYTHTGKSPLKEEGAGSPTVGRA